MPIVIVAGAKHVPVATMVASSAKRSAFPITETELKLIAAPAIIGLSKILKERIRQARSNELIAHSSQVLVGQISICSF